MTLPEDSSLKTLYVSSSSLAELDLSTSTEIESLTCGGGVSRLDLSACTNLTYASLDSSKLDSLVLNEETYGNILFSGLGDYTITDLNGNNAVEWSDTGCTLLTEECIATKSTHTLRIGKTSTLTVLNVEGEVAGEVTTGNVLTAEVNEGANVNLQWYRVTDTGLVEEIEGANGSSYTPVNEDVGCKLRCEATGIGATNGTIAYETESAVTSSVLNSQCEGNQVKLSWNEVTGASYYTVECTEMSTGMTKTQYVYSTDFSMDCNQGEKWEIKVTADNQEESFLKTETAVFTPVEIKSRFAEEGMSVLTVDNTEQARTLQVVWKGETAIIDASGESFQLGTTECTFQEGELCLYEFKGNLSDVEVRAVQLNSQGEIVSASQFDRRESAMVRKASGDETQTVPTSENSFLSWSGPKLEIWRSIPKNETFEVTWNADVLTLDTNRITTPEGINIQFGEPVLQENGLTKVQVTINVADTYDQTNKNTLVGTLEFTTNEKDGFFSTEETITMGDESYDFSLTSAIYDINHTGTVDIEDLVAFARTFGLSSENNQTQYAETGWRSDFDASGDVGIEDLVYFARNFGKSAANGDDMIFHQNFLQKYQNKNEAASAAEAQPAGETFIWLPSNSVLSVEIDSGNQRNTETLLLYAENDVQETVNTSTAETGKAMVANASLADEAMIEYLQETQEEEPFDFFNQKIE